MVGLQRVAESVDVVADEDADGRRDLEARRAPAMLWRRRRRSAPGRRARQPAVGDLRGERDVLRAIAGV